MQLLRLPQAKRSMELTMDAPDTLPLPKLRATQEDAKRVPHDAGRSTGLVMRHGTMELRWFAPNGEDPQTPHDRDELYIITSGTGVLTTGLSPAMYSSVLVGLMNRVDSLSANGIRQTSQPASR